MSDYNQIDGRELDRHITGNYGEDQFEGMIFCENCDEEFDEYAGCCPECGAVVWEPPEPDPDALYDKIREEGLFDDEGRKR